jgi:hypothetical protein
MPLPLNLALLFSSVVFIVWYFIFYPARLSAIAQEPKEVHA